MYRSRVNLIVPVQRGANLGWDNVWSKRERERERKKERARQRERERARERETEKRE